MRPKRNPGALAGATGAGNEHRAAAGDVPEHSTQGRALPPEAGHETSDRYARTLATSGRWRVIRCGDDLQFVLQERGRRAGSRPWRALAFIYSPSALGAVLHRPSLGLPGDDLERLMAGLPRPAAKVNAKRPARASLRYAKAQPALPAEITPSRGTLLPREITRALGGRWFGHYGTAPCPVCQPERRRDQRALSISEGRDGKLLLRCHKGDCAFASIMAAAGLAPGAVSRPDPAAEARRKADLEAERKRREGTAWRIWQEARPARGTLAERYLRGRHLALPEGAALRFHPAAPHPSGKRLPAMVARIDGGEGFAAHCTYLAEPGRKAPATPAKAIFGLPKGGAVRLIAPPEGGPLLVGEGIETTLAAVAMFGAPAGGWAALSVTGMIGLNLAHIPPGASIVALGDGDEAGLRAMRKLAARAHAAGINVRLLPAPQGRDWADVLELAASRNAKGGAA